MDESFATAILVAAVTEHRAAELLDCLFAGGSCTVNPDGELVLASSDMIQQLMGNT